MGKRNMRIKKIVINNFRAFKHAEIEFEDFNCIIGKNDAGKSTIFAALEWFLDENKRLNETDFAAAGFDFAPYNFMSIDEKTGDECIETGETAIYDGFCISVDVYFSNVYIPERTTDGDFIFSKDFIKDNCICIRKYMHPSAVMVPGSMGYKIKKHFFKNLGKTFTECGFDELKSAYSGIGKNVEELCNNLNILEEESKKVTKGISLYPLKIKDEKCEISQTICTELYNYYTQNNFAMDSCFVDENMRPFLFPEFKLFTSKTPIKEYLNELFPPKNYDSVERLKERTAQKLSELLNLNSKSEILSYKKNEKINLFSDDSLEFTITTVPLNIPLRNRGEGLQLKIKNAVFRLLSEIQSKNQGLTLFAFEEPETHMHPSAQIEMYETIKKLSENKNYQVLITTHSPYIVKELAKDNIIPTVVKRNETSKESVISKLDERVLPYVSMNEINYIAFDEPSIEYHIELYAYMQNKLGQLKVSALDDWLKDNCTSIKLYNWCDTRKNIEEKRTLPYCVRNQIDHPNDKNKQYESPDMLKVSIEIMRTAIKNKLNN